MIFDLIYYALCYVFWLPVSLFWQLISGYFWATVFYYSACVLLGTPCGQPLLSTVWLVQKEIVMGTAFKEGQTPKYKLAVFLKMVAQHLFWRPILGLLLMTDSLLLSGLYNRPIKKPLFVKSGARSGSTVMGQILDCDKSLVGVAMWFSMCPYLTFWMLIDNTIGKMKGQKEKDKFFKNIPAGMPEELRVRHEFALQKPDTFDVPIGAAQYWGMPMFGTNLVHPAFEQRMFVSDLPAEEQQRAIDFIEEVMQKWALWNGLEADQHLLLKSHLVSTIPLLKKRYPDAAFITVTREPKDMYTSLVPFNTAVATKAGACSTVPDSHPGVDCGYLCYTFAKYYQNYCEQEARFVNEGLVTAVPFKVFIKDIPASMDTVYAGISKQWGEEAKKYVGSSHEEQVNLQAQDPEFAEEKKWRKSLKATYPSGDIKKLQNIVTDYAKKAGIPNIDMETDPSFVEYRKLC
jgi:hypothetical protein